MVVKENALTPASSQIPISKKDEDLKKAFLLPHSVAFEPFVQAFQFKNSILFTNSNLFKIGNRTDNLCSFDQKKNQKRLNIFFCDCPYSNSFRKCVESYYCVLLKEPVHLILFGLPF